MDTGTEVPECGLETPHKAAESMVKERDSHLHDWGRCEEGGSGELGPSRQEGLTQAGRRTKI